MITRQMKQAGQPSKCSVPLAPLALRTIGGLSGFIAAATGFIPFFIITAFAAVPAMALMLVILKFYPPPDTRRAMPA